MREGEGERKGGRERERRNETEDEWRRIVCMCVSLHV